MDWVDLARAGAALLLTVGAMLAAYMVFQRLTPALQKLTGAPQRLPLRVIQTLPLDAKRRLCVVRHSGTDHLILTGPSGDTLISSGAAAEDAKADIVPLTSPEEAA